jgi:K+-sensing histidine kinase KdpD
MQGTLRFASVEGLRSLTEGARDAAGMAATLLQPAGVNSKRANQMGELISRQVAYMSRLVEDLLDVSRVSRGLLQIE